MKPRSQEINFSNATRLLGRKIIATKVCHLKLTAATALFLLLFSISSFGAPLSGTYTIPGSYSTLAAAITALNTNGISGTVTINIAAGYTETAPTNGYQLTATGTSSNQIIFQKSGTGADPLITAYTGGTASATTTTAIDGIFRLFGSSYVTINGIDLQENPSNTTNAAMMEFGYGLFKVSGTQGCQNDIIENCVITLNKTNFTPSTPAITASGSVGILVANSTNAAPNTALTVTSAAGENSNNVFIGNTITNVFAGIFIVGYNSASPYTYYDQYNIVGRSGKGNTITDFGSGTAALTTYGIYEIYQNNDSICYNTINNLTNGGAAHTNVLYGIYQATSTNSTSVVNNNSVTLQQAGNAYNFYCIDVNAPGTGSVTISNNTLGASYAAGGTGAFYGIYNVGMASTATINNNNFNAITVNTTGTAYMIYNAGGGSTGTTCTSNHITTGFTKSGAGGSVYGYYSAATTVTSGTEAISKNNFSNITITGATGIYGIYTSTADAQNKTINTDTLTGWTGGTSAIYGINMDHLGSGSTIYSNYINNNSGASTVYGINLLTVSTTETTVSIYSNIISNLSSSAASGTIYGIYQQNAKATVVNIYSNTISGLSSTGSTSPVIYGIILAGGPAYTIYSNSINTFTANSAATKPYLYGIYSSGTGTGNATKIYKNTIYNFNETGSSGILAGVELTATNSLPTIDTNAIYKFSSTGTGVTIFGIYNSGTTTTVTIDSNYINNLSSAAASGTYYCLYQSSATVSTVNVYSNTISNISSTGATSPAIYCIDLAAGPAANIYYNSINTITANSAGTKPALYAVYTSGTGTGNASNIYHNTFYNFSETGASGNITILDITGTLSNPTIDSNAIYKLSCTGTGGTIYGIYVSGINSTITIDSDYINNLTSSSASETICAISQASATATTVTIYNNTITNITPTCNTSPVLYGIKFVGGPATTIYSNTINTFSANSAATSPGIYGIYSSGAGTGNVSVYSNSITSLNATGTGATIEGLYLAGGGTTLNIYSNTINTLASTSVSGIVYGIYQASTTSTTANIYSNTINSLTPTGTTSPVVYCIRTALGPNYSIYSNSINTVSAASAGTSPILYGIYSGGSATGNTTTIYKNNLYNFNATGTGATVYGMYIASGSTNIIYNNFISDLRTPATSTANAIVGINVTVATTNEIYYNTIYLNGTSTGTNFGSSCITFTSTVLLDLRNNILANASNANGTGYALDILRTTATSSGVAPATTNYAATSNYNCFYVQTIAGNYDVYADRSTSPTNKYTKGCSNLASYQGFMGSNRDDSTVFELPPFTNISSTPYTLTLNTTTATQCESGGVNIAGFTTDYYGNIHQGNTGYSGTGTQPDIGADEFNGTTSSDVNPPVVSYTPFATTSCTTAPTIVVTITDPSHIATGGDAPRIYYKKASDATNTIATVNNSTVNGWKYVTASSTSGSVYTFTLNYSLFSVAPTYGDSIRYFIVAQDSSPAKNIYQNASTFSPCPSLIRSLSSANTVTMNPGAQVFKIEKTLSGTYTVGATGGSVVNYPTTGFNNFTSLTLANGLFAALNNCLVTGNITATINANLTSETGANVLNQWQEVNTGTCTQLTPSFTLTIKPATATQYIISGTPAANTALITLNGADRVTIDGSYGSSGNYLRFLCSTAADNTIKLTNDATYNTLKYLQVEQIGGTGSDIVIDESVGNTGNTNNTITQCIIRDATTGSPTKVPTYGIWSGGTGVPDNSYITISNNQISNFSNSGIDIVNADNNNNIVIKNNSIFYNSTVVATATTQQYGINFAPGEGSNDSITYNIIGGSTSTGTGTWTNSYNGINYGIYLSLNSTNTVVCNNRINNITASATGTSSQLFGIYLNSGLASITNDTISGLSTASTLGGNPDNSAITSYGSAAMAGIVNLSSNTGNTINNNIISSLSETTSGGTLPFITGIGLDSVGGTVQQNQIYGLTNKALGSGTPSGISGIRISAGTNWRVINNMISLSNSTNTNPTRIVGIYDGTSGTSSFYYNSVFIGGAPSSGSITSAAWDCIAAGATDTLNNNIFLNVRTNSGSASGNHYGISVTSAPSLFVSDYNDLYSAKSADIGNIGGAQTFANWQSNSGGDANSVSDSILFYGPSTGNLNLDSTSNCYIYHSGTAISGITKDYNNKTRNNPPDMGAVEFNLHQTTTANVSPTPACVGTVVNLTCTTNVVSANTYKWIGPSSYTSATQNPSLTVISGYAGTFSDTVTDKIGCKSSASATLAVNPLPTVTVPAPSAYCTGNSTTLTASGATTYTWSPITALSATTGSSVTASPTTSTTYTITGTNSNGCVSSTTVAVAVNPLPTVTVPTPSAYCTGNSTTLTASGATTYTWSPVTGLSATTGSLVTASPTTSTTYTITGTNSNGCVSSTTVAVAVNPLPTVTVPTPSAYCTGNSTALTASGATTYTWSPVTALSATTGSSVTASPTTSTTYTITGTNSNGCVSSTTVAVAVSSPAVITTQPSNLSSCTSNISIFSVVATGATSYQWQVSTNGGTTWANLSNGGVYSNVTSSTLTVSYPTSGMNGYEYMCTVNGTAPCTTISNVATLTMLSTPTGNWMGVTSSDWNTASNWCGGIPTGTTDVIIASGTPNNPVINGSCYCHNITINSGASVTFSSGSNLSVAGTITNSGTLNNTLGTITLCGSSSQTFPGTTLHNLTVNNSAGITLSGNLTITDSLILTNGIITTGVNRLIVSNTSGTSITGQSSSSYVNGNLRQYVAAGNTYNFPVGTSSNYELATLKLTSAQSMTYIDGLYTSGTTTSPNVYYCQVTGTSVASMLNGGYWTLTPDNYTGVRYDLTLNETGYTNSSVYVYSIGLIKRHNSTSNWLGTDSSGTLNAYGAESYVASYISGTSLAIVKRTGLHNFSDYGIGIADDGITLPIELVSFTADAINNKTVNTTWVTASQSNSNYFEVQRSADGINFDSVGTQQGCGTCSEMLTYNLNDPYPLQGISYYRLKEVDKTGNAIYSDVVTVDIQNTIIESVNVYPNPTADKATLDITGASLSNITIYVSDILGRQVLAIPATINAGINNINLPTAGLTKGIYFIEVNDTRGQNSFKLKLLKM